VGKRLAIVAVLAGAAALVLAWPRINVVETGRTPEYPDLQPREYAAGRERVATAVREALADLPRWSYVGFASGAQETQIQAVHATRILRFKDDVAVSLGSLGQNRTRPSVRSRSRLGRWDFGQNARNIRELLAELDRRLPGR
jgi:uncharacterized protein (DUF1499 family)